MPYGDEFVRRFPALSGALSTAELDQLLAALEPRELLAGEVLVSSDKPSSTAYLLLRGSLEVVMEPAGAVIGKLEPGSFVGEVSFLDGGVATATVIVVTPALVLGLEHAALERLRKNAPRVAASLVRAMTVAVAARVRRATDQLEGLRFGSVPPGVVRRPSLMNALRALMGAGN